MPFYIRVPSLINPVHCITQTEEPNLFRQIGEKQERIEILDWYHLIENLQGKTAISKQCTVLIALA